MIPGRVRLAVGIAFIGHGLFILTARYRSSFDAYTHMLFASHYAKGWFSLWESRWYAGFTVVSYPPLVHQLIALLVPLLGFEAAFALILWMVTSLYPLGVYAFSRVFVGVTGASYAALASALLLPIYISAYVFGQLPFLTSTLFALLAAAALARYLREGTGLNLALAVALIATVMAAHHATLLVLPFFILAVSIDAFDRTAWRIVIVRLFSFVLPAILAGFLVIWPFWQWGAQQTMQVPIDHLSRHNFISDPAAAALFLWPMYGPLIAVIPFLFGKWPRRFYGLVFSFMLLFGLGLGGTTPLPLLLFGNGWEWLTYDRFAFWACLTLLPFFGRLFIMLKRKWAKAFLVGPVRLTLRRNLLFAGVFSALTFSALAVWFQPLLFPSQPAAIDMHPIVNFLKQDDRSQWRYLTFGFGNQYTYLNLLTSATTIDGSYHTARTIPELRDSGIGEVDTAYWTVKGVSAIDPILKVSSNYGVRWGFVNHREYIPELEKNGWLYRRTLSNGVGIWENPNAILPNPSGPPPSDPFAEFSWGSLPLLAFMSTLALTGLRLWPVATRKTLTAVQFMAIGLLPLSLTLWYFRSLHILDYPGIYFTYDHALFFLSDGLALIAVLCGIFIKPAPALFERRGWLDIGKWFFALSLLASLSILWSLNRQVSLYVALHWWLVFGLFMSVRDAPQAWRAFAIGCCAGLAFEFLAGFGEFALQTSHFLSPLGLFWPGALDPSVHGASVVQAVNGFRVLRSYGTLPHPNILGGFVLAFLAGPLALFIGNKRSLLMPAIVFSLGLMLLLLTFSRAAWLGLLASVLVILFKFKAFNTQRSLVLCFLALLSIAPILYSVRALVSSRVGMTGVDTETNSIVTRSALVKLAFDVMRAHPVLGVGIGNNIVAMGQLTPPNQLVEPTPDLPMLAVSELGIGAIIILSGLGISTVQSVRGAHRPLSIVFGAITIGVIAASLFDHYFWTLAPGRLLLGLLTGLWASQLRNEDA